VPRGSLTALTQIEESVARYLQQLDSADRPEPSVAIRLLEPASITVEVDQSFAGVMLEIVDQDGNGFRRLSSELADG
jgi:hypothetical protein